MNGEGFEPAPHPDLHHEPSQQRPGFTAPKTTGGEPLNLDGLNETIRAAYNLLRVARHPHGDPAWAPIKASLLHWRALLSDDPDRHDDTLHEIDSLLGKPPVSETKQPEPAEEISCPDCGCANCFRRVSEGVHEIKCPDCGIVCGEANLKPGAIRPYGVNPLTSPPWISQETARELMDLLDTCCRAIKVDSEGFPIASSVPWRVDWFYLAVATVAKARAELSGQREEGT